MSRVFVTRVSNDNNNYYDIKFIFKATAFAYSLEPIPVCPHCNGYKDTYGMRMYPDDEPTVCPRCRGTGKVPFHVMPPHDLNDYLTKCIDKYFEEIDKRPPDFIGEYL